MAVYSLYLQLIKLKEFMLFNSAELVLAFSFTFKTDKFSKVWLLQS